MAHHVVHLPCDADALLEHRATSVELLGTLRTFGSLRGREDQLGPRWDIGAERRRPQQEAARDDHRAVERPVGADDGEDHTRCDRQGWDPQRPARVVGRQCVRRDGQRRRELALHHHVGDCQHRSQQWQPASEHQDRDDDGNAHRKDRRRPAHVGRVQLDGDLEDHCGNGQHEVGGQHVPTRPTSVWAHSRERRPFRGGRCRPKVDDVRPRRRQRATASADAGAPPCGDKVRSPRPSINGCRTGRIRTCPITTQVERLRAAGRRRPLPPLVSRSRRAPCWPVAAPRRRPDDGPTRTEPRPVQGVHAVDLRTSGDLTVTTGPTPKLTITAGRTALRYLTSTVHDGTVILGSRRRTRRQRRHPLRADPAHPRRRGASQAQAARRAPSSPTTRSP